MRLNRDEGAKKLWIPVRQKKEFADLHELFEKIFCIPVTSAPVECVFNTSELAYPIHAATQCTRAAGATVNW